MGDEYHKNYNELITLEKTLNGQITELQKCLDVKNQLNKARNANQGQHHCPSKEKRITFISA